MIAWRVETASGSLVIRAFTPAAARRIARAKGYAVKKVRIAFRDLFVFSFRKKWLSLREVTTLLDALSRGYAQGLHMPYIAAMIVMPFTGRARAIVETIADSLREGRSLEVAFRKAGAPEYLVETMRAVGYTGDVGDSLAVVAEAHRKLASAEELLSKSMVYPKILMWLVIWITFLILSFAVPKIAPLVEELIRDARAAGSFVELGPVTYFVFAAGKKVSHAKLFFACVFMGTSVFLHKTITPRRVLRVLSFFGVTKRALDDLDRMKFYYFFSMFIRTGMVADRALRYSSSVVDNPALRDAIKSIATRVSAGGKISDAMRATGRFSEEEVGFIAVGERTGDLDLVAQQYAEIRAFSFEHQMSRIINMLPVLSLVAAGAYIIGTAAVVLLPIFDVVIAGA